MQIYNNLVRFISNIPDIIFDDTLQTDVPILFFTLNSDILIAVFPGEQYLDFNFDYNSNTPAMRKLSRQKCKPLFDISSVFT